MDQLWAPWRLSYVANPKPAAEPDPARDLKTGDADAEGDADQEGTHAGPLEPAVEPSPPGSTSRST